MGLYSLTRRIVSFSTALTLALAVIVLGAVPAQADVTADLQLLKTVEAPGPYGPGDTFTYQIQTGCSSTNTAGCFDAAITDTLPDPLVFDPSTPNPVSVSMSPAGSAIIDVDQETGEFTVTPEHALVTTEGPRVGLTAGGSALITVQVMVPTTISADWNGETITNVAHVTAENADPLESPADVSLVVETTLVAGVSKSVAPSLQPAAPGRDVTWTIEPSNQSNQTVDQIVVEDVFDGPGFDHLDFSGITATPGPDTTTSTTLEYLVGSVWTNAPPTDLTSVEGIRVTYDGSFAPGVGGEITIDSITNDLVSTIDPGDSLVVSNSADVTVAKDGTFSPMVDDDASMTIRAADPTVTITKSFTDSTLVVGQAVTANVMATVGDLPVETLVIVEPSTGQPTFSDQGLEFTGFGPDIEWPIGAVSAQVEYTYSDCVPSSAETMSEDSLPAPTLGCTVDGFTVTFSAEPGTNGIVSNAYAALPIEVTALTGIDTTLDSVNHVDTIVTDSDGATGTDAASAAVEVRPLEVFTDVAKRISPDEVWAVSGADATVSLPASVTPASTIGSDHLTISDPVDPSAGSEFFDDYFDVAAITDTDIPACADLTVNYWDRDSEEWLPIPGAEDISGPVAQWNHTVPVDLRADMGGIQFVFTATPGGGCAALLQPGFNVIPNFDVELQSGVTNADATVDNDVQSAVFNQQINDGDTDDDVDGIELNSTTGGPGPDLVDKTWLENSVLALSGEGRTTRISWSTAGLNFANVAITDPASVLELGPTSPGIETSVYDAFNLQRIAPITAATDPMIVHDRVSKVELFLNGTWTDVTTQACPALAECAGGFPGLTLTADQQANTTGVRITFTELVAGEGVGSSYDRRPLDLGFRLRDTLRSTGDYVLGNFHDYTYNTGEPGVVDNTVNARGWGGTSGEFTTGDSDTITILESPHNVNITKDFDQSVLGVPVDDSDPEGFPLITATIKATNKTASKISSMVLTDPGPAQADPDAYDVLDLHDIDSITVPTGLTNADVVVTLDHAGTSTDYTYAQALALSDAELADVVAVTVSFAKADGSLAIPTEAQGGVVLTWQLRTEKRSGGPVAVTSPGGIPIVNEAHVQIESPGRIPCPGLACSSGADDDAAEFNIVAGGYSVEAHKSMSPSSLYEEQSRPYTSTLMGQPNGNARTTLMTLTDDDAQFWNVMDFTSASATLPRPINQARMDVFVAGAWVSGDWIASPSLSAVHFTVPASVTDTESIEGVRFEFRSVVDGDVVQWERPYNPRISVVMVTERRETQRINGEPVSTTRPDMAPNEGESDLGVISNTFEVEGEAQFGTTQEFDDRDTDSDSVIVRHRPNAIRVVKSPGNTNRPPTYTAGGTVPYQLVITNTGDWDMTGFKVVDQFDLVDGEVPVTEPDPTQYAFTLSTTNSANPVPSPAPEFTAALDPVTGTLAIQSPDDFVFMPGWTLTVNAPMLLKPDLGADDIVSNAVTATSDRTFETCDFTIDTGAQTAQTTVDECTATTRVQSLASATLSMSKWVKGHEAGEPGSGDDDLGVLAVAGPTEVCDTPDAAGFHHLNCLPVIKPGGVSTWRLDLQNSGNTNAKVVAIVDTLPAVGDRGVVTSAQRGSEFDVTLRHAFEANHSTLTHSGADVRAYYSSARLSTTCNQNAIFVHTNDAAEASECGFAWTEYTSATSNAALESAESVKFVVDWGTTPGAGLVPGETLSVSFDTRAPVSAPDAALAADGLAVAYNSFAATSRTVATSTQGERTEIVLEPTKVGIAVPFGQLSIDKIVEAPEFSVPVTLPDSYSFALACTSDGEGFDLLDAAGDVVETIEVDVSGTSGSVVVGGDGVEVNLPLFADCLVTEVDPPAGTQVDLDPVDGSVMADGDLSGDVRIHDAYAGTPANSMVEVTNTFFAGDFEIVKTVDNGGAVDQDGTGIAYDQEFEFDVVCTYLDETILDTSVTLADGGAESFIDLPTGAECVIEETESGAATVSLTVDGSPAAHPAAITVGEETQVEVEVTNTFTTGSVLLTKSIIGVGADDWGTEPVELQLVCTLDAADPNLVFDASMTLNKAPGDVTNVLTWQVDDLPTGADCLVTETRTGGANSVEINDAQFTVGAGSAPLAVAVDNDFDEGSIVVEKSLSGPGASAQPVIDGEYVVALVCTREVDGDTLAVAVPGGAERTIVGAGTAEYEGLPTGAECILSEVSSAPVAQDVTLDPVDGSVEVPAGNADPVVVTVDNFFDEGYLQINKLIEGPGAGLFSGEPLTFQVACTLADQSVFEETVVLTPDMGQTALFSTVFGGLTVGTECHVLELDWGNADDTTLEAFVTITAGTADTPVVATIANTYGAGDLEVTKVTSGKFGTHSAVKAMDFEMTVMCQLPIGDGDGGELLGTVFSDSFTIKAGETVAFTDDDGEPVLLPTGSSCFVEETQAHGATQINIEHDSFENGALIESINEVAHLDLVVDNVFDVDLWTPELPKTGADMSSAWLVLGVLSALAGMFAVMVGRRRLT